MCWERRPATDIRWVDTFPAERRPILFLSEGMLPYIDEAGAQRMVLALRERFPGAELVFDAITNPRRAGTTSVTRG